MVFGIVSENKSSENNMKCPLQELKDMGKLYTISLTLLLFFIYKPSKANPECDCNKKIPITLTGTGTALSNYQIPLDINYLSGMQSDFSDIRFTSSNGTAAIFSYIETFQTSSKAYVWVKVPSIPANSSTTIYMYYDCSGGPTYNNNPNYVFDYYNDFNSLNSWSAINGGTVTQTTVLGESVIKKINNCDPAGGQLMLNKSFTDYRLITREIRQSSNSVSSCGANRYGLEDANYNGYTITRTGHTTGNGSFGYEARTSSSGNNANNTTLYTPWNNWYRTELIRCCSNGQNHIEANMYSDNRTLLGGRSGSAPSTRDYCGVDRFTVRGGREYSLDFIAITKYSCDEPTTSIGSSTIADTQKPIITCPPNPVYQPGCVDPTPPVDLSSVTATDNCGTPTITHVRDVVETYACSRAVLRTYRATDASGNFAECTQRIPLANDVNPPFNMVCPPNQNLSCNEAFPSADISLVTAEDGCNNVTITHVADNIETFACSERLTRIYRATDDCGNYTDCTQEITRPIDNDGPTFTVPADVTIACTDDATNLILTGDVTDEADNCTANNLDATYSDAFTAGSCPDNGTFTRTWSLTDDCGNSTSKDQTITIEIPNFTIPANGNSIVECVAEAEVQPTAPTVNDACGNLLTPTVTASTPITCEGDMIWTFTYTDCAGNANDWTYTYTVDDTTAPTGTAPTDLTVECVADVPVANIEDISDEADNCGGDVTVTVSDTDNGGTGCADSPLVITRTFTLTDCGGLSTDLVQTITVQDSTAPVWTTAAGELDREVSCSDQEGLNAAQALAPNASENCTSDVLNISKNSGDIEGSGCGESGIITNTWTVTDDCGNISEIYTQTITITDNEAPIIEHQIESTITVDCTDEIPAPEVLTYTDNCGESGTATYTEDEYEVDYCNGYSITRRWNATDECGNAAEEVVQIIQVNACDQPEILEVDFNSDCLSGEVTITETSSTSGSLTYILEYTDQPSFTNPIEQESNLFELGEATYAEFSIRDNVTNCESDIYTAFFGCVLPVKISSFTVQNNDDCNLLEWTTSTEVNNDYFVLEYSLNGVEFTELAKIDGAGTTSQEQYYSFCDNNTYCSKVYYRLKQVDFDHTEEYVNIISTEESCETNSVELVPNPFLNHVLLSYSSTTNELVDFRVIDAIGRVHVTMSKQVEIGRNEFSFDWSHLAKDTYFVQARSSQGIITLKAIKIK